MIWKQTLSLESLDHLHKNSLSDWLGVKFLEIGADFIKASMPVNERTKQPMGLLHGGASLAFAETLGSIAASYCVDDPSSSYVVGVEINASHLSMAKDGEVIAIVSPVKVGTQLQVWNISICQEEKPICLARLTTMTVARK